MPNPIPNRIVYESHVETTFLVEKLTYKKNMPYLQLTRCIYMVKCAT